MKTALPGRLLKGRAVTYMRTCPHETILLRRISGILSSNRFYKRSETISLSKHSMLSYRQEEIAFQNGDTVLAGTLCLPEGSGPFPAVLLLPGAGSMARDGLGMFPHYWEAFTRRGIATLSWDKPGIGASSGDWTTQSQQERAEEGVAALNWLRRRSDIAADKVGLWGISQAGQILPLIYTLASEAVAFMIAALVPPDIGDEQELFRVTNHLLTEGYELTDVDRALAFSKIRLFLQRAQAPYNLVESLQRLMLQEPWLRDAGIWDQKRYEQHMHGEAHSDILSLLKEVRCPFLAVFGERDTIINGQECARLYTSALKHNPDVTVTTIPQADHALFLSQTGGFREMDRSFLLPPEQQSLAPGYLDLITQWVQQRFILQHEKGAH